MLIREETSPKMVSQENLPSAVMCLRQANISPTETIYFHSLISLSAKVKCWLLLPWVGGALEQEELLFAGVTKSSLNYLLIKLLLIH